MFGPLAPRGAHGPPDVEHVGLIVLQPAINLTDEALPGELLLVFLGKLLRPGREADMPVLSFAAKCLAVQLTFTGDIGIEVVHTQFGGAFEHLDAVVETE